MLAKQLGLSHQEQTMFKEIANIINKYKGVTRHFGLSLTHSHFPLKKGEMLHEINDKKQRFMIVKPLRKVLLPKKAHPTAWTLKQNGKIAVSQFCCAD